MTLNKDELLRELIRKSGREGGTVEGVK